MRRRIVLRGAALALLVVTSALGALPAGSQESDPFAPEEFDAEAPPTAMLLQYGWWNKSQQSPAGGNPTPPPPGAPSDGIYVFYGPTGVAPPPAVTGPLGAVPTEDAPVTTTPLGPEAFGALRYSVPPGSEASLTLRYVPTSTSQPGGLNPDVGQLFACPISSPWDPVQNGRYEGAPTYDCGTGVQAAVAADTVTFTLPASLAVDGVFDLAIVPGGTQPFEVGFPAPFDQSLALTSVPEEEFSEEEFAAETFEDPAAEFFEEPAAEEAFGVEDFDSVPVDEFGTGEFVADGALPAPVAAAPTRSGSGEQVAQPTAIRNPLRPDASRTERILALGLLTLLAIGLWYVGGQPVRPPRLLGSLGAGVPVATEEVRTGGIGRFARVRPAERPPRLF